MLQIDEFRRGIILAENDEFLAIKWPPLPGWPAPAGGSSCYPALTVVYRKNSVSQHDRSNSVERLIAVTPVIEWENSRAPPQAEPEET